MQLCGSLSILWHCLSLGLEWKLISSSPCGHCWVFQICWHIECSTFTVSSFRIWNSSTGIPSPSLALFIVMLPKAYLTFHSRMSGSRWVITPSWLSRLWRSLLQPKMEKLIRSANTRPGADCGSDHELLIAKFRLQLKKVGKTMRPLRYDLNQIP